jgi:hypothetical protein
MGRRHLWGREERQTRTPLWCLLLLPLLLLLLLPVPWSWGVRCAMTIAAPLHRPPQSAARRRWFALDQR